MDLGERGNRARDVEVNSIVTRVENGEDLVRLHSTLSILAKAALSMSGVLGNVYGDIWDTTIAELKAREIGGQIYTNRGDLGSGKEDGDTYLHVFRRGDQMTNAPFAPLDGYQERVLRASTEQQSHE